MERLLAELLFHDEQARERASYFRAHADELRFDDAEYLDHETWIRPAFAQLGPLQGKRVLDYGCGHGMASVVMALAGVEVSAFDLSPEYVEEAERRADANGVTIEFQAFGRAPPTSTSNRRRTGCASAPGPTACSTRS